MDKLNELYRSRFGAFPERVELLPLSGSSRRYWRMEGPGVRCIGCSGASQAENRAFLEIDAVMRSLEINVPEVYAVSEDGLAYLQEDLGDGQLFGLLKDSIAAGLYTPEEMDWLFPLESAT